MKQEKKENMYTRKQYYVKSFQVKFVMRFCLLIILASMIMGSFLYLFSLHSVTTAFENSRLIIKSTADFILPSILASILLMLIIISIVSVIMIMMFSHRIAGPLYRFEKFIMGVKDGYLSNLIFLRGSDEVKEIATALNDMSKQLCTSVAEAKREVARLTFLEDDLVKFIESKRIPYEEAEPLLKDLSDIKNKLHEQLNYYKT